MNFVMRWHDAIDNVFIFFIIFLMLIIPVLALGYIFVANDKAAISVIAAVFSHAMGWLLLTIGCWFDNKVWILAQAETVFNAKLGNVIKH